MLLAVAVIACGTQPDGIDASTDATTSSEGATCSGPITSCCRSYCNNDVGGMPAPICVNGVQACPSGYVSDVDCKKQHPCDPFCLGFQPPKRCISCDDGGSSLAQCDADAAVYACPSGSYLEYEPDASSFCAADAGAE